MRQLQLQKTPKRQICPCLGAKSAVQIVCDTLNSTYQKSFFAKYQSLRRLNVRHELFMTNSVTALKNNLFSAKAKHVFRRPLPTDSKRDATSEHQPQVAVRQILTT